MKKTLKTLLLGTTILIYGSVNTSAAPLRNAVSPQSTQYEQQNNEESTVENGDETNKVQKNFKKSCSRESTGEQFPPKDHVSQQYKSGNTYLLVHKGDSLILLATRHLAEQGNRPTPYEANLFAKQLATDNDKNINNKFPYDCSYKKSWNHLQPGQLLDATGTLERVCNEYLISICRNIK